jgi:transposase-like protein
METTQLEVVEQMQKHDRRGRRITSAARKEHLLAQYDQSGMTQARFAREHGIVYQTFVTWVQKRRRHSPMQPPAKTGHFIQVHLAGATNQPDTVPADAAPQSGRGVLCARFAGGLEVSSCDAAALAALIKALRN